MKQQQIKPVAQQITTSYQGPIPPAIEMERYATINPDFPSRILAMAEQQLLAV
ncbi:MAG: hypothetical protein Q4C78_00910 [Synergistaceae bacterium]|nr:hypothetical protein [Synergistaceae bacterium]